MKKLPINFFQEEIKYELKNKNIVRKWLNDTIIAENHELETLNFIFCSDDYLLTINLEYLNHDTLTDIITFDNSNNISTITGDIYISLDRVKENSKTFKTKFTDELHRVIIHGTLHLLGYDDKSAKAKMKMTKAEDKYLTKRIF
ncbi:MAG: rRNA maturation RNase YbeY [Sphingobacteriales bacterium]|nr:MAG: rRNA maturation RNase YbeY [Sphingobacteriales bacterium]